MSIPASELNRRDQMARYRARLAAIEDKALADEIWFEKERQKRQNRPTLDVGRPVLERVAPVAGRTYDGPYFARRYWHVEVRDRRGFVGVAHGGTAEEARSKALRGDFSLPVPAKIQTAPDRPRRGDAGGTFRLVERRR